MRVLLKLSMLLFFVNVQCFGMSMQDSALESYLFPIDASNIEQYSYLLPELKRGFDNAFALLTSEAARQNLFDRGLEEVRSGKFKIMVHMATTSTDVSYLAHILYGDENHGDQDWTRVKYAGYLSQPEQMVEQFAPIFEAIENQTGKRLACLIQKSNNLVWIELIENSRFVENNGIPVDPSFPNCTWYVRPRSSAITRG